MRAARSLPAFASSILRSAKKGSTSLPATRSSATWQKLWQHKYQTSILFSLLGLHPGPQQSCTLWLGFRARYLSALAPGGEICALQASPACLPPGQLGASWRQLSSTAAKPEASPGGEPCWSCGAEWSRDLFFCPACQAIQPPSSDLDYFATLGVERRFDLDLRQLEARYKALQKKLHPDLFATRSQEERRFSADQSSRVITAYYTLLRPLPRARYLLELQGVAVGEGDEGTISDQELLVEIMEIREAIEDARDEASLRQLLRENEERLGACIAAVALAFESGDLASAQVSVQRLSYYTRIQEELTRRL